MFYSQKHLRLLFKKIRRAAYCIPLKHIGNKKSTFTLFILFYFYFFIVSEENVGIISKIFLSFLFL